MYQELIVVIVEKYRAEEVMAAAKRAGAHGGTIMYGKGVDGKDQKHFFDILIEPEKEVVFILSKKDETQRIVEGIDGELELSSMKNGVLLVLDVFGSLDKTDVLNNTGAA